MRTLVLGGGFAGMAAALRLALEGHEVTLLEREPVLGGKAQGWNGIPTGPTVLTMAEVVRSLFARAGAVPPVLHPVSPLTRYLYSDGREFAPELALGPTLAQLEAPEKKRYVELLETAHRLYDDAKNTFLLSKPPELWNLAKYGLKSGARAFPLTSLEKLVQSGPYLTPFFLRFATYLGANPYMAPAVLHNIAWVELGMGVWHAEGGFAALVNQMAGLLEKFGVTVELGVDVKALEQQGGRVTAAVTSSGTFRAEKFVSALDRIFTLELLGRPIPRYPLGVSGFALLLRLEESFPLSHQVFFPQDYALEWSEIAAGRLPSDPTIYLHTDGERAFVLVNSPAVPQIHKARTGPIGAALSKTQYAQFLLERLQKRIHLPVLEKGVRAAQDYSRFGFRGALYGRAPSGLLSTLRHKWQFAGVGNLWQVGGTVHPGGGVPLSLLSGWNGAGQALGLEFDALGLNG